MPLHAIEDPSKLRRIIDAMLLIGTDLELPQLLRHIVEEARAITGARYGAIGVLNSERTALAEFITVGLEPEEEVEIGKRPKGLGVLGLLMTGSRDSVAHHQPVVHKVRIRDRLGEDVVTGEPDDLGR